MSSECAVNSLEALPLSYAPTEAGAAGIEPATFAFESEVTAKYSTYPIPLVKKGAATSAAPNAFSCFLKETVGLR